MAIAQTALQANQAEFELELGPHAPGELRVLRFGVDERISAPFEYTVTLAVPPDVQVDAPALIGQRANLYAQLGEGNARHFDGIVRKVKSWDEGRGTGEAAPRVQVEIVPTFWKLSRVIRSRIFQEKTVEDILDEVLGEPGDIDFRISLTGAYTKRIYCVQYRESDFAFLSRLMEEEGIFYFFEHTQSSHTLVITDAASTYAELEGGGVLPFREKSQMAAEEEFVHDFSATREIRSGKITLRDFNQARPLSDLTVEAEGEELAEAETQLEVYDYPGNYEDPGNGKHLSKRRLERERARAQLFAGASICRRLTPGGVFTLEDHPLDALNGEYVVVEVRHRGTQHEVGSVAEAGASSEQAQEEQYANDFLCVKKEIAFRPEPVTPRPVIAGAQTALVVGPAGEEIHTDAGGRIKVHFHWDREGKKDDHSSCWIRVSQAWAGPGWGALYLPRIGQEVVVEFLEGDPDRPLVTGSVYNGVNPPPVSLPGEKTKSTIKTASSPGGGGFNELRFEDSAGSEEIYLHAQKDLNIVVENDKTQTVGGNESLTVTKDRTKSVGGNQSTAVAKNDKLTVGGEQVIDVSAARTTTIGAVDTVNVVGDQLISVGGAQAVTIGLGSTESVGGGKMLNVGAAYAVTVGGTMNELVGGSKSEEIGGAKVEVVKGKKSEMVMGARSMKVGTDYSEQVEKTRTLKVDKNVVINVKGKHQQTVAKTYKLKAKEIVLDAGDQFTFKVGNATLQLKKNGDIVIKGAKIQVNAKGDLILKSSKISQN